MSKTNQPEVLMYHGILRQDDSEVENREVGAEIYDVPLPAFEEQLKWLSEQNYSVQKVQALTNADEKSVILTFDDGELNNFTEAVPVLKRYNFPAYFFVIGDRIGKEGYLGWDELRQMQEAGMVIGSHGLSHHILTSLLDTQIEQELKASKQYLDRNLETETETLSIPRGFCNDKIINMAYEIGYKHVFISDRPAKLKAACISRTAVKSNWDIKRFEQAVKGEVPPKEKLKMTIKSSIVLILGNRGYNLIRSLLIKIMN